MFKFLKKPLCTPEEQVDAILGMFSKEELEILRNPKLDIRELILERVKPKTKQVYRTVEEAVDAMESLVDLARVDDQILHNFDRLDVGLLADALFFGLFEEK